MEKKWVMNRRMQGLMEKMCEHSNSDENLVISIKNFTELIIPNFRKVKNCIIIAEESSEYLEQYLDDVLGDLYYDETDYEFNNTEIRINSFFENDISEKEGVQIAMAIVDAWIPQFKKIDSETQFCFVIYSSEDHVEFRFHKRRDATIDWLEDIEAATEGIGYLII